LTLVGFNSTQFRKILPGVIAAGSYSVSTWPSQLHKTKSQAFGRRDGPDPRGWRKLPGHQFVFWDGNLTKQSRVMQLVVARCYFPREETLA